MTLWFFLVFFVSLTWRILYLILGLNMNRNRIVTTEWSNMESRSLYSSHWANEPSIFEQYENGDQCGGCSFFAPFNSDWGLCCHPKSRHHLETVFEHFTCPVHVRETNSGWGPHSFSEDPEHHCRCGGASSEYWDNLVRILDDRIREINKNDTSRKMGDEGLEPPTSTV
jgi:hypothetical protein